MSTRSAPLLQYSDCHVSLKNAACEDLDMLMQLWPEEKFPLKEFGRMVLDENVQNYFADVESIAFDPGVTVPGELSPCPHSQPVILAFVLLNLEQCWQ